MTRIWLNHWFSTAYNIIRLLREDNPDFVIIGSNEKEKSPIQAVCDEWYREPVLKGEAYVDFCLKFCDEHSVDVFMPRREMIAVSKYKDRFEAAGVRVMADDYHLVNLFAHKDQAYEAFRAAGIGPVPDFYMAGNAVQFCEGYAKLAEKYDQVCFKSAHDEGGKSYRLIDNSPKGYAALYKKQTTRMSFDAALKALSERESFSPIMLMPYLPGEEISVDCLMTDDGLIAIPRIKDATRIERVRYKPEILDTCRQILERFPLRQPCNIQFKYLDGVAYLLEINTRMSGGVQMACAVSGVNIPGIAVNKLLGIRRAWVNNGLERDVTHVEVPVVL